jgi:hypothetical protein
MNSFSLAFAFFIQSSTSVVLSGSGGTIFNGSPFAAAKKRKEKQIEMILFLFIIPFQPPEFIDEALSITAA